MVEEFWKSVNIWRSYGQEYSVICLTHSEIRCVRLPNNTIIFRAELYAVLLVIDAVRRSREKIFVTFSDSVSSLQAIKFSGFKIELDLIQRFIKDYSTLSKTDKLNRP